MTERKQIITDDWGLAVDDSVSEEKDYGYDFQEAIDAYLCSRDDPRQQLVSLGFPELDDNIGGGVERGEMVVVAARPSHGKSAFGLHAMHHVSKRMPCVFISEEMGKLALGKRGSAYILGGDERTKEGNTEISEHFQKRYPTRIYEGVRTIDKLESILVNEQRWGTRFCVVDYAQLLQTTGRSRYEEITNISIGLRRMSRELDITMMIICQLGRAIEERPKFIPRLSDLKDSGQLEQDADVILFLVWPARNDPQTQDPYRFQVFCAKNRNRQTIRNMIELRFFPPHQRFFSAREWTGFTRPEIN